MNRLPDFSAISRSQEEPVSQHVSLHIGSPESAPVASGTLSCDSATANDGVVFLDVASEEDALRQVDWLLSDTEEYLVAFMSLSKTGREARFEIKACQELE